MAKLNQIIAIEKGIKSQTYAHLTDINKLVQKPDLFNGFAKNYQPNDVDGDTLPPEKKRVQFTATETLRGAAHFMSEIISVTARKDWTNCVAKGDVKVDGVTIFAGAPVSFLLFIEKQLTDLRTLVGNLPVLDEAEEWDKDEHSGLYRTSDIKTHRTKKTAKPIVLYQATPEHPAQTQLITEDVIVGYWVQQKLSGAIPKPEKEKLLERIEKLQQATKQAREAANMADEVEVPDVASAIFNYLSL